METFEGFPYLITCIGQGIYHIILLPCDESIDELKRLVRLQVSANKLETCLVLESKWGIYIKSDGRTHETQDIPQGDILFTAKLRASREFAETEEWIRRKEQLQVFVDRITPQGDFVITGDLSKGGWFPSNEERHRLSGKQPNGIPKGLTKCLECGDWKGVCLDQNPELASVALRVHCLCENDNLCAWCEAPLYKRKLNSNYYNESDGQVWHAPSFSCLSHRCQLEQIN